MKFTVIALLVGFCLGADFITDIEYGKMLYKNPRGIGCNRCHGDAGEGTTIAEYKEFDRANKIYHDATLKAPQINRLSLQEFTDAITNPKDVMPTYFLTKDEIIAIYKYIKEINEEEK